MILGVPAVSHQSVTSKRFLFGAGGPEGPDDRARQDTGGRDCNYVDESTDGSEGPLSNLPPDLSGSSSHPIIINDRPPSKRPFH